MILFDLSYSIERSLFDDVAEINLLDIEKNLA